MAWAAALDAPPAPVPGAEPEPVPEALPVFWPGAPRFNGCPQVCTAANLPAHETPEAMAAFHARNGPSCKVVRTWQCEACGCWHMETHAPAPAGASSGTTREFYPLPERLFRRRVRESAFGDQADLPRDERERPKPAESQPKKIDPIAKKAIKDPTLGELFQRQRPK